MKYNYRELATMRELCLLLLMFAFLTACGKEPQLPVLLPDAVILAFGDSLTAGTGANDTESYPAVLAKLTGRKVVNAGIPGEMSASGAARLPEAIDRERPALLILCHGGNDLLARQDHKQIAENLRLMIRAARERSVAVMLLAVPTPDLTLKPPSFYAELAREFGLPVELKTLPRIMGNSSLKSDHIHPNAAGYGQLAESVAKMLRSSGAIQK
jgi:lysophospholipase L1-like esterase